MLFTVPPRDWDHRCVDRRHPFAIAHGIRRPSELDRRRNDGTAPPKSPVLRLL